MGAGAVRDIFEDAQVAQDGGLIHHKTGAGHTAEIKVAKRACVPGLGLHHFRHLRLHAAEDRR